MGVHQLVLNIALMILWALLHQAGDAGTLVTGYGLGAVIVYFISRATGSKFYLRRVTAAVELFLVFVKEVILANIKVAYQVLHPSLPVVPGFFQLPLEVKSDGQITLLAMLITMTPGTLSVDVSPDRRYLIVHALDVTDPEGTKTSIKEAFERRVLEVLA